MAQMDVRKAAFAFCDQNNERTLKGFDCSCSGTISRHHTTDEDLNLNIPKTGPRAVSAVIHMINREVNFIHFSFIFPFCLFLDSRYLRIFGRICAATELGCKSNSLHIHHTQVPKSGTVTRLEQINQP